MLARAAQRYGIIVRDQTGHDISFYAEDPTPTGSDPFHTALGGYRLDGPYRGRELLAPGVFPWRHLQLLPIASLDGPALNCGRTRGVAQPGSAFGWGPKGRRFKSDRPDSPEARFHVRWLAPGGGSRYRLVAVPRDSLGTRGAVKLARFAIKR